MLVLLHSIRVRHEPFYLLHAGKLQLTLEKQFWGPEQSSVTQKLLLMLLNYCLITDWTFNRKTIIPPLLFCRSPGDGPEPHAASSQVSSEMYPAASGPAEGQAGVSVRTEDRQRLVAVHM